MAGINLDKFIAEQIEARPIEAKIVKKIVKALEKAGTPVVAVWDGEERTPVSGLEEVNRQVFNLDEAYLYVGTGAWVRLVMGEEYYMLNDYNVSLEDALAPVNDFIDKHI